MSRRSVEAQPIMRTNRLTTVLMFSSSVWPVAFSDCTVYASAPPRAPTAAGSALATMRP